MWSFEYEHSTTASPAAIWALWSDVARWIEWDTDLESVTLEGDFAAGVRGVLTPKGTDGFPFMITRAVRDRGYSDETPLPGAVLRFDHELVPGGDGTIIRQRVTMEGPGANELFDPFASNIILDIPRALARLAERAERAELVERPDGVERTERADHADEEPAHR